MYKKYTILLICLLLASSVSYAGPFDDKTDITDPEKTSVSKEETSELNVKEEIIDYEHGFLLDEGKKTVATDTKVVATDTKPIATGTQVVASDTTKIEKKEEPKTTEYTVVKGDYLSKIAAQKLGDYKRWPELVELNKDRYPSLVSNPNLIYPGWVLKLPGSSSSTSTNTGVAVAPTNTSTNSGNVTSTTPSASDNAAIASGKAPKYTVESPSGAPTLKRQSNPSGSVINTQSANFKSWLKAAIDQYGDWNMPAVKNKYGQTISVEMFMKGIMYIETGGTHTKSNGSLVTSSCGAQGFMQLMPATAKGLGVNASDPKQNIAGGCKLFQQMFSGNSGPAGKKTGIDKLMLVACSYNCGPYSKLVKGSWQDLKNSGSSVQSYGIKLKMCLGLELTQDEVAYAKNKMHCGNVDSFAANCYATAQGYGQ